MDGKATEEVTSLQKRLSANHNPGWNDPPKLPYGSSQGSCATPTKRVLNKRVAFPLSPQSGVSAPSAQSTGPPNTLPPPTATTHLTTLPHAPTSENHEISIDKKQALEDSLANLQFVIDKHVQSKAKSEELQKRLSAMRTLWLDDKLNDSVHKKILKISNALKEENVEEADKVHISLMMEHASLCSSWISGIRHLILELREHRAPSTTEECATSPYLLPTNMK